MSLKNRIAVRRSFFRVVPLSMVLIFASVGHGNCGDNVLKEVQLVRYHSDVNSELGKDTASFLHGRSTWVASRRGEILELAYGKGAYHPQYAALHLDSGYFRMIYGKGSEWGTSIVVVPSFWEKGVHYQAARVEASCRQENDDLVISVVSRIGGLCVEGTIRIHPPAADSLAATVAMSCSGSIDLDDRANETFKPLLLSSMYVSKNEWDASRAVAGAGSYNLPEDGWIFPGAAVDSRFGLVGGSTPWKKNAPSVEITLDRPLVITGWVSRTDDPNCDNVGLWASAANVLPEWKYTVVVKP